MANFYIPLVASPPIGDNSGGGGSGGGALVVNLTVDEQTEKHTCDKTAGEMYAACPLVVFLEDTNDSIHVHWLDSYAYDPDYGYMFSNGNGLMLLADTADDYPTSMGG